MQTKEEILEKHLRESIPDGHELSESTIKTIEGYRPALEAMEEYAKQFYEKKHILKVVKMSQYNLL
jgi:hypothetical protein